MQDTEIASPNPRNMSPYLPPSKYESPCSSRSQSPCLAESQTEINDDSKYMSDDEISVGCPSPALNSQHASSPDCSHRAQESCRCPESDQEDYFKPLKRLKMVNIDVERRISPTVEVEERPIGVKSFSILDILNHRPSKAHQSNKIVRPWDLDPEIEAQQSLERFHRHLKAQQLALLRPDFANFNASYTSETGSDRSSSVASDCCSPDIVPSSVQRQRQNQNQKQPGGTPLDALFQMTSKTFDSTTGETSSGWLKHSIP